MTRGRAIVILLACAATFAGVAALRKSDGALDLGSSRFRTEVLYPLELPLRSIDFNAALAPDSYLIALFNQDAAGYAGVRLSKSPLLGSVYFEATPEGKFLRKEAIPFSSDGPIRGDRFRISLDRSEVKIFQNGNLLRTVPARLKARQAFGFRSGERPVHVDVVAVTLDDGTSPRLPWPPARAEPRDYNRPRYYPGLHLDKLEALENGHFRDLTARGKGVRDPRKQAGQGSYRILFVGTSQTLGVGALKVEDRWTERFVRNLRRKFGNDLKIESAIAGSLGGTARDLIAPVQSQLSREKFNLVVADLSALEYDRLAFLRSLESIFSLAQDKGAETVFVLEPNSVEVDDRALRSKHRLMLSFAAGKKIPVLDLHYRLSTAQARSDSGMIWQDFLNLTSFGQALFADAVTDYFLGLLR